MFWGTIVKDTQLLLRDRGALISLFLLPLAFVVVFGGMMQGQSEEGGKARPLAVYAADDSPKVSAVMAALEASEHFTVQPQKSGDALRRWVSRDEGRVGLILPAAFDPASGRSGVIVIDTGTPLRFRGPIVGALQGMVSEATLSMPQAPLVVESPPHVARAIEGADGFQVSVPGNAVFFGFFIALTMAISFVEERQSGAWKRLLAAPVHKSSLLLAKLVPFFLVGVVQMIFLFGVGAVFFGMRVAGSPFALALMSLTVVFAAVALGLLIASLGGTQKQVGSVGSITLLVMGMLGGAMIPRVNMPEWMQEVGLATPHAWALEGFYDVLLRQETSVMDILPPASMVMAFGVAFAAVGALMFRFQR